MNPSCSAFLGTLSLLAALLVPGCTFLPSNGPSLYRVKTSANRPYFIGKYVYVPLTETSVDLVREYAPTSGNFRQSADLSFEGSLSKSLQHQESTDHLAAKPSDVVIAGDVVSVTIFDKAGGLFASPIMPNGLTLSGSIPHDIPSQVVDLSGQITVPYAGRIDARGRTLSQIQTDIESKLASKTVEPQVIATLKERTGGDKVTVLGDIKSPMSVPVSMGGTRLLDAIAAVGGSTGKEFETYVTVNRGHETCSSTLSEIYDSPSKNIYLRYGDSIYVRARPLSFLSFGANGRVAEVPFQEEHLTLAKALARVGGADDNKANPSSVLIYRLESSKLVSDLGKRPLAPSSATCPVIYRLDLTKADGFMIARNFTMRDHDIVYTASAGSVGVMKFLGLLGGIFSPVAQAGGAAATTAVAAGGL